MRVLLCLTGLVALCGGCKDGSGPSPLVDLANRLYLDGEWTWVDSMMYSEYAVDGEAHRGAYVVTGTASLETLDSLDYEAYAMTATAVLFHVDSVAGVERTRWTVSEIEYVDTVEVRDDTIFGLAVEPIPPEANPNTNVVRWVLDHTQLWCTNWLTDSSVAGNGDGCETRVVWMRGGGPSDSTPPP